MATVLSKRSLWQERGDYVKAYVVTNKNECVYSTVVFAETRGKAIVLAQSTDACEDVPFTEISAHRVPQMDKYYRGKSEMAWYNPDDRIALVKEAGFHCADEIWEPDCVDCPAKEYCDRYQDRQEDEA